MKKSYPSVIAHDYNSPDFTVPAAFVSIPCLSGLDIRIINLIYLLTNQNGECNLTNQTLAKRCFCSKDTVSGAISKANALGFIKSRKDTLVRHEHKDGYESINQTRTIQIEIPTIWKYIGNIWHGYTFDGIPECKDVLDWVHGEFKTFKKNGDEKWLVKFKQGFKLKLKDMGMEDLV